LAETEKTPQFTSISEIADFAMEMTDENEAVEFIKIETSKLPVSLPEDILKGLIEAVSKKIKDNGEKTEDDYLELLHKTITFNTKKRLPNAKEFIKEYMMDESLDFVEAFIDNSIKSFFSFENTDILNIKGFYKRAKKDYDFDKKKGDAISDLGIDSKYDGMYTIYVNNKGDLRLRINPHPDKIADLIIHENFIISYKDSLFIYRSGFFRNEPETVQDKIVQVLNEICKGDNADYMIKKSADILAQIRTKTRVHVYPFNDYKNALPVENGIIIFDFDSGTCECIDHDPEIYKFNYKIPIKYDPKIKNIVIYDMLKGYTKNSTELIQIPAQAFMQNMGHGPYKRAYLIHGEKNSGKTTFIELLEYLVGDECFCDVSLDKLNQRFQIASIEGKVLNMHDDMGYFTLNDTGMFKTLTGRRKHDIERKGVQPYIATLDGVHVFTTNIPAKFDARVKADEAFWERWSFITFDQNFCIKGNFKADTFTPENMTAFLNDIIDEMLRIGKNGKLSTDVNLYDTREKWMLAGNPLYKMVNELMEREILTAKNSGERGSKGTAIIKEELLKILQLWCLNKGIDDRAIPDSLKDLTSLVDACGWDTDEQRVFKGSEERKRCYVISYKWKPTAESLKYSTKVSDIFYKQNTLN
jgi:phage/plasmid-associated DNA primase